MSYSVMLQVKSLKKKMNETHTAQRCLYEFLKR